MPIALTFEDARKGQRLSVSIASVSGFAAPTVAKGACRRVPIVTTKGVGTVEVLRLITSDRTTIMPCHNLAKDPA